MPPFPLLSVAAPVLAGLGSEAQQRPTPKRTRIYSNLFKLPPCPSEVRGAYGVANAGASGFAELLGIVCGAECFSPSGLRFREPSACGMSGLLRGLHGFAYRKNRTASGMLLSFCSERCDAGGVTD